MAVDSPVARWTRSLIRQMRVRYVSLKAQAQNLEARQAGTKGSSASASTSTETRRPEPSHRQLAMPVWDEQPTRPAPEPTGRNRPTGPNVVITSANSSAGSSTVPTAPDHTHLSRVNRSWLTRLRHDWR